MRAIASIAPVAIPEAAAGTTTPSVTRHCGAPNASAPSRKLCGTSLIISSVVRATIGTIIKASAMPPARAEKCFAGTTTMVYTKTPVTIEGIPVKVSTRNRTKLPKRPVPNSERKIPTAIPNGKPISDESPSKTSVPRIALPIPPPSPTGRGLSTKKCRLSDPRPRSAI